MTRAPSTRAVIRAVLLAVLAAFQVGPADAGLNLVARPQGVPIQSSKPHMVAADFNGDGKADVMYTDETAGRVLWLFAAPERETGFETPSGFPTGRVPSPPSIFERGPGQGVEFAVVDADARGFWFGVQDGNFTARFHPFGPYPIAIALADWNGDDLTDIALAHSKRGSVTFLLNDGSLPPRFRFSAQIAVGAGIERLFAYDANGDGAPDLLTIRTVAPRSAEVSAWLRRPVAGPMLSFEKGLTPTIEAAAASVAIADVNGDADPDLLFLDAPECRPNGGTLVLNGRQDGSFGQPRRMDLPCPFFSSGAFCPPTTQAVGDWTGDGLDDLAVFLRDPRRVKPVGLRDLDALQLFASRGATFFSGPVIGAPRRATAAVSGDFDGDGAIDLVASFGETRRIVLYENRSTPGLRPNGEGCSAGAECLSGHCVEGVCCAQECSDYESCALPMREGTCQNRIVEIVPCRVDNECFDIPDPGDNGMCVDGFCCAETCHDGRCDVWGAEGRCYRGQPSGSACCSDLGCASGYCRDGRCCDSACEDGYCGGTDGRCVERRVDGDRCEIDAQCTSGICDVFDRVCCADSCGSDATCSAPGSEGRCVPLPCVGDCNGDSEVGVAELIRGIRIVLGKVDVEQCLSFDSDGDQDVAIGELIAAVRHSLEGCGT